jgi:hypothetical protein
MGVSRVELLHHVEPKPFGHVGVKSYRVLFSGLQMIQNIYYVYLLQLSRLFFCNPGWSRGGSFPSLHGPELIFIWCGGTTFPF